MTSEVPSRLASPRHLVVPVETKVRELDAKLLLALVAAEAGWTVVLGSQEALRPRLHRVPPGVYLDKSASVSKREWFRHVRNLGHRLVAWDEEGLVYFDAQSLRDMRLDREAYDLLDLFLAWGDHQLHAIQDMLPGLATPMEVTGNPRFDLLRPEFRALYAGSTSDLRSRFGRFILVNTSFPFANHHLGSDAMHALYRKYPVAQRHPAFFVEWAEVHQAALAAFRQMIPELARAFPDHNLVVRPHPSERVESWLEWTRDLPRVRVESGGPVVEWIQAADFLVHFDCTTGIEAFVLDVPAIAFDDESRPGYRQPLPNALSLRARTSGELIALGRSCLAGQVLRPRQDPHCMEVAQKHMAALEGPWSAERVVAALDRLLPPRPVPARVRWRAQANSRYDLVRQRLMSRRTSPSVDYARKKFPPTPLAEIQDRARRLHEATRRFNGLTIRTFAPDCFEVAPSPLHPPRHP